MVSHDVKLGINSVILKIFLAIFFRVVIGFLLNPTCTLHRLLFC